MADNLRDEQDRPLIKLSVNLIDTYKFINKVYYDKKKKKTEGKERPKSVEGTGGNDDETSWDDKNYDYIIHEDRTEVIHDRYAIEQRIGKGSFGQVVSAHDKQQSVDVAVKIIKSKTPFTLQAKIEIDLLTFLNKKQDEVGDSHIVKLTDSFMYRKHQCLVFEKLSYNLYELLRKTNFAGVSLNLIGKFARQLLDALEFLARPDIQIIHCDVKPENVLLKDPTRSYIKLIDFGSSCRAAERMYTYIQSRFYRSPEVILGLPYTVSIDMWSLACVLVEMHTGEPLFSGTDQYDQLVKMIQLKGMPSDAILDAMQESSKVKKFFKEVPQDQIEESGCKWHLRKGENRESTTVIRRSRSLESVLGAHSGGPGGRRKDQENHTPADYLSFIDLLEKMLEYDPKKRITPAEAMRHPALSVIRPSQPQIVENPESDPGNS